MIINGAVFEYPASFDENWGVDATGWAQAVTNGMLQMAGGSFPLTAEVDFGGSFGVKALYLKSRETNIASSGIIRLSSASGGVVWRNNANSGNLVLTTNASDQLLFNGTPIGNVLTNSHIFVGNAFNVQTDVAMSGDTTITNTGAVTIGAGAVTGSKIASNTITDTNINSAAAIAVSKLAALAASSNVRSDASGFLTTGAINLSSADVTGNLGVTHLNSGTNASSGTYWRGDGTWSSTLVDSTFYVSQSGDSEVTPSIKTNGTLEFDKNSSATGPVFGDNLAGVTFRDTNEPANGTKSLVFRSGGGYLFENTSGSTINWLVNLTPTGKMVVGNITSGRSTFTPQSTIESYGNIGIGIGVAGVTAAPTNGLLVDGQAIFGGTTTNDNAAAGKVGEYIVATTTANTNAAASGNYDDLLSISLTAGDWEVSGGMSFQANGATWSVIQAGISTTAGNNATGLNTGDTLASANWADSSITPLSWVLSVPGAVRMSLASTTTVYLKRRLDYSAGTPRTNGARISARRVR